MIEPQNAAALPNHGLRREDLYVALFVLVMAWIGCRLYLPAFRAAGGRAMTYYDQFGPAVMAACGRGFVNPSSHAIPSLDAFLLERVGEFDCREIGERPTVEPLNDFQAVTRNLLLSAAAIWRVTGVSWIALDNLAALMFSVAITAAYLVMRIIMGPVLALLGALVWGISPLHLGNVAHLRDYSKAPFFALTALAMALAICERRPRALIAIAAAFGLAQGIGLGMRTDVVLNFAPFFLVLFALGSGGTTTNIAAKFAAAVLSLSIFVAVAWPVLTVYNHSEGLWHVSLLGLTSPFDRALNVRRAPYEFGYLYDDSYVSTVVQAYWNRAHHSAVMSLHDAGLYNRACKEYYTLLASTFPADFLTRMAGSALHVLNLPFTIAYGIAPLGVTNAMLTWLSRVRTSVLLALSGTGPIAVAYLLFLVGIRDRLAAGVGLLVLLFWACYPYLQFHERHVFHLEILTIGGLLWALRLTWDTMARASSAAWTGFRKNALQSAAIIAAAVTVAVVSVAVARVIQQSKARALFGRYARAAEAPIVALQTSAGGDVRVAPALFEPARRPEPVRQAMLVMDVSGGCTAADFSVHVRYASANINSLDFSRDLHVHVASRTDSTRVFIPAYSIEHGDEGSSQLANINLPAAAAPCVRLSRAPDLEREPLMLDVTLAKDWTAQPMYERLYLGPVMPERVWVRLARWWPGVSDLG